MRRLYLSDLHHAACALRCMPPAEQCQQITAAILRAEAADRYRKRRKQVHPLYGNGTLSGAFGPVKEADHCDADYLAALTNVTRALQRLSSQRRDNRGF